MTQLQEARAGRITPVMRRVAHRENVPVKFLRDRIAAGRIVIPANVRHAGPTGRLDPVGIGRSLRTKVNACIASPAGSAPDKEMDKLHWAMRYGADAVMDITAGDDAAGRREHIIAHAQIPLGTVPLYQMVAGKSVEDLNAADILQVIEMQARQGVDYFTIHAGILREHLPLVRNRIAGISSRGGSLLAKWMIHHDRQNPLYELFDDILAIMREYDVCCSLGDGLRPGCLADASDEAQWSELRTVGELVHRAREMGVQVIVEGPGHVSFDRIAGIMEKQAQLCDHAPFYVLGPVVSDVFPGYDHITAAIGATAAAYHGAAFLCYVTPREQLGLPRREDIKQGCVACRIAAHAADVARGLPGAREWDDQMSRARAASDWERQFALAFDPDTARILHEDSREPSAEYSASFGHEWSSARRSREVQEVIAQRTPGEP